MGRDDLGDLFDGHKFDCLICGSNLPDDSARTIKLPKNLDLLASGPRHILKI
jgi:hypothetical protein